MPWIIGGAAVVSGLMGASAARSAASAQSDAADRATQLQREQMEQQRADLAPWVATGKSANNRLLQLLGLEGSSGGFTPDDPSYSFRFNEGQKAVENGAASRGMSLSGGALKALQKYGQDTASTEFQNQFSRLAGLSGQGQNAAAGQGAASMNFGQSAGNNITSGGAAQAAGQMGAANAWSSSIGQGVNNYFDQQNIQGYQRNQLMRLIGQGSSGSRMEVPELAPFNYSLRG